MLYAILCYDDETVVTGWTAEEEAAAMERLGAVHARLEAAGRLGPVGRLASTSTARTVRKGPAAPVTDGPFAETKEQLLGFYLVECETPDDAEAAAQDLAQASSTSGCYEVRPLILYHAPGEGA